MGRTLLVVDDSKISRKVSKGLLQDILGDQITLIEADSGEQALAQLSANAVDFMLLDLTMPGISGYDVLAVMSERGLSVPVLVLSADIQPLARERVLKLGASGFMKKPLTAEVLKTELTRLGAIND
jgi:two-component system chemotaxis response regulator CheY